MTVLLRSEKTSPNVPLSHAELDENFRTLRRVTERFFFTTDTTYGAVGDGSNDDTGAFLAAIAACGEAGGGVVVFPAGRCKVTETLLVSYANVTLYGAGGDMRHTLSPHGGMNGGTILDWQGAAGGTMVKFTSGENFTQKLTGGGLSGFTLDAQSTANICLDVTSWNNGRFTDLMLLDATSAGLLVDVVSAATNDARDPQENLWEGVWIRSVGSGDGVRLQATVAGANPSYNYFRNFYVFVADGIGVNLYNCDNNFFEHFRVNESGSGSAVVFQGSDSNVNYVPRDNVFYHLTTAGAIIARGTSTYTHPSGRNACFMLDQTNTTVIPTIEAGAYLSYSFIDGVQYLMPNIKGISADGEAHANAAYDFYRAGGVNSHVFVNDSDAHIRLMTSDNASAWNIVVEAATGNLSINRAAGTGYVNTAVPIKVGTSSVAALPTGAAGMVFFATNGRKNGEGAASGTGVLVFHDGTAWRACDTGATVAA